MIKPYKIKIVEVGPRDGLQNENKPIDTNIKIEFIKKLATSGLMHIEATSFVSKKWIPQLADGKEVLLGLNALNNLDLPVLVPNLKGLENAISAGAKSIAVFTTASDKFARQNINCSVSESLKNISEVLDACKLQNIKVRGYLSCVLGCPYEGNIPFKATSDLAKELFDMGCYEISLGDTIGIGTANAARELINTVATNIPIENIAAHFHDTYGQALANIYAVLQDGVRVIDSSVAGLGGCPYAVGASGNVATEDVVYMLNGLGLDTGVDLPLLIKAGQYITAKIGTTPRSKVSIAMAHKLLSSKS